jgi:hypothetical protein
MPTSNPLTVSWTDASGGSHTDHLTVDGDPTVNLTLPLVILLHGTAGTIDDMSNPSNRGFTFDTMTPVQSPRDRGVHSYPNVGVWGFALDDQISPPPTGWQPFLRNNGFMTLNYAQIENTGSLQNTSSGSASDPVLQLHAIVMALIAAYPSRRLAFVTHSRGGILLRTWLVRHGRDAAVASRLCTAVMLASPNAGSDIANVAVTINGVTHFLEGQIGQVGPLQWLDQQTGSPAYVDYQVGSSFLASLAAAEPVPGITITTFGGTNPNITRVHQWTFTLGSALPNFTYHPPFDVSVSFHWFTDDNPVLGIRNLAGDLGALGPPEIKPGSGDLLVSDASSNLPFAAHLSHPANHAQELWDPMVLADGLAILTGARCGSLSNVDGVSMILHLPPSPVAPGAFQLQAQLTNIGTTTWDSRYTITADDGAGHAIWGTTVATIGGSIPPSSVITVATTLTAPSTAGTYHLRVMLQGPSGMVSQAASATLVVQTQASLCASLAQQLAAAEVALEVAEEELGTLGPNGKPEFPGAAARVAQAKAKIQNIQQQRAANHCP